MISCYIISSYHHFYGIVTLFLLSLSPAPSLSPMIILYIVSLSWYAISYPFIFYPFTLHPFLLYHIIVCYIILYHRWLGPRAPQLIGWATGKDSGATELKTMEHEKASDTWRENNIRTITMQSPIPRFAKNTMNRTIDELSISLLALSTYCNRCQQRRWANKQFQL